MKYGLIGYPLGQSYSKEIHEKLGLDYQLMEVENLDVFMKSLDFQGFNVTIPYKEKIIAYLDSLDEKADEIGAVNTVVRQKDGSLKGYNTDYYGLKYLMRNVQIKNSKVAILGSGGTSHTAQALCRDFGASEIIVISRKGEITYEDCSKYEDADVLINTTPVGMSPKVDEIPINLDVFTSLKAVVDVIYNPLETALVYEARKRGIYAINGLEMLVAQALFAEEIFLNIKLEDLDISEIVNSLHKINIVIIGMPGCGKSTVGKLLADKLKMDFYDSDILLGNPGEIIENCGEKEFRLREREVIKSLSPKNNSVVAVGGGSLLLEDNIRLLRANGTKFVLVLRDLDKLDQANRPLSKDLQALWEARKDIYYMNADIIVENNGSISECVEKIYEIISD
ncbi:MAG: shikimate dehydrogenase [Clostridia bacterium]|nr:shikimate dehydrogenase [Clostridia bacterium]